VHAARAEALDSLARPASPTSGGWAPIKDACSRDEKVSPAHALGLGDVWPDSAVGLAGQL
jgi:hypothetical protein